jgi:hypothetical protein
VTNTVAVTGTGLDPLTMMFATLGGGSPNENSIFYPVEESGTSMVLLAPALLPRGAPATIEPLSIPVGARSLAGESSSNGDIVYAGVPSVTSVVNSSTGQPGVPDSQSCPNPPPADGCGTPITIAGSGFDQSTGPLYFYEPATGTDLSTQFSYDVTGDSEITTQSVQQNPDAVTPMVCSNSGCAFNTSAPLYVYPPGDPTISSITNDSGPAQGGNQVTITGTNLGCAVEVLFGSTPALDVSNAQALLDCGQTGSVEVTVPPALVGTVHVSIVTLESEFSGSTSNSVSYNYDRSAPSAPQSLTVDPYAAAAKVTWTAPASNGGDSITGFTAAATAPGESPLAAKAGATATSFVFRHLQPGIPWSFSVVADSKLGSGLPATSSNPVTLTPGDNGYIVATSNGGTFGFGSLTSSGGPGGVWLASPIVGISATPNALGYVEVAADGRVYNFGNAGNYGSATVPKRQRAVGIAETVDGAGYWVLLGNGSVQPFGDALTFTGGLHVHDAVAIAATPDGQGYYVVEATGAVSPFGDGASGLQTAVTIRGPIVGIAVDPVASGYWLLARGGTVYEFGAALGHGSPSTGAGAAGIAAAPDGNGYWVVSVRDKLFHFGSAQWYGTPRHRAQSPAVGIVAG